MSLHIDSSKPLLLIFPFDLLSHYLRCLELAKSLKEDYDVRFAWSYSYSNFVDENGFTSFRCKNFDARQVMGCAKKFNFSWLNERDLEEVYLDQVKVIKELKPTVVLGDTSPTLKMAAETAGVKHISLMNGYMSKHYAFVRKLSRTHPAYPFSKKLPESIFDFITKVAEQIAFWQVHRPFKALRKKYGLKSWQSYLDELEGDVNLICDLPDIFPQKQLPKNYRFIRPLFHTANFSSDILRKIDPSKKTIVVSMGSSGDWHQVDFLNDTYFSRYNIVTAADDNSVLNAPHIISTKFVNASELFPATDLVICHGGNGTIYQALSFGIPVLCKTTHFEQEWNLHGLERTSLGKSLDDIESSDKVANVIEQWIDKKNTELFLGIQQKMKGMNLDGNRAI